MADLYFLVGSLESETAGFLIRNLRRRGFEIKTHRVEVNEGSTLTEFCKEKGIEKLPCLMVGREKYFGLIEIRRYLNSSIGDLEYSRYVDNL